MASKRYGIAIERGENIMSGRSVFLIDSEGIVRYADSKYQLKPDDDHDALIEAVKKFSKTDKKDS